MISSNGTEILIRKMVKRDSWDKSLTCTVVIPVNRVDKYQFMLIEKVNVKYSLEIVESPILESLGVP